MARREGGTFAAWLGIFGNLLLTVVKVGGGIIFRSQALLADGVHNLSDLMGSVAVLVGHVVAVQPADAGHPYGHRKAESIAQKIVAILLLLAGLDIFLESADRLFEGSIAVPGAAGLWIISLSIPLKEALSRYQYRLGKNLRSKALLASAAEHRTDVYSAVAALLGIALARLGHPAADPLAAGVVSLFIVRVGWRMVREAIDDLMDKFTDQEMLARIREVALSVPGVKGIGDLKARGLGGEVQVDLEIAVPGHLKVEEGHRLAHQVRDRIIREVATVTEVRVHVNPARPGRGGFPSEKGE